jgi:hypothetical protein
LVLLLFARLSRHLTTDENKKSGVELQHVLLKLLVFGVLGNTKKCQAL